MFGFTLSLSMSSSRVSRRPLNIHQLHHTGRIILLRPRRIVNRIADRLRNLAVTTRLVLVVPVRRAGGVSPPRRIAQDPREEMTDNGPRGGEAGAHHGNLAFDDRPMDQRIQAVGHVFAPSVVPEHDDSDNGDHGQPAKVSWRSLA